MIKAWQCSLCPMQLPNDNSIEHRKDRHNEKHTRGWSYKAQRDGGGNNTMGVPKYTEVYED